MRSSGMKHDLGRDACHREREYSNGEGERESGMRAGSNMCVSGPEVISPRRRTWGSVSRESTPHSRCDKHAHKYEAFSKQSSRMCRICAHEKVVRTTPSSNVSTPRKAGSASEAKHRASRPRPAGEIGRRIGNTRQAGARRASKSFP